MASETFRYYCLDGTGQLHEASWFHAQSDDDAVEQIRTKHPDSKCEIWQGGRLVAAIDPIRRSA